MFWHCFLFNTIYYVHIYIVSGIIYIYIDFIDLMPWRFVCNLRFHEVLQKTIIIFFFRYLHNDCCMKTS